MSFLINDPNSTVLIRKPIFVYSTLAIVIVSFFVYLLWPKKLMTKVDSISWFYKVDIERNEIRQNDGFYPDGGAFDIQNQGTMVHHFNHIMSGYHDVTYTDRYSCGQSCSTSPRICSSGKNRSCSGGNRTCTTNYCTRIAHRSEPTYIDVPEFRSYYSWKKYVWVYNRTVNNSGSDYEPKKPELNLNAQNERATEAVTFKVILKDKNGESFEYVPTDLNEYKLFKVGQKREIKSSVAGITIIK